MRKNNFERIQKRKARKISWRPITVTVIAIVLCLIVYIALFQTNDSGNSQQPERTISDFSLVSNSPLTDNGKIVVLFIGSEACPFCAAESWSLVGALQQYGTLTGLTQIISNSSESIPNVPGYSFVNASFQSKEISFWEVETTTTSWNHKLQAINTTEELLFAQYDPHGRIPFLLVGGLYLHIGSGVSPEPLANVGWAQCQKEISTSGIIYNQVQDEADNITNVINYLVSHKSLFNDSEGSVSIHLSPSAVFITQSFARQSFPSVSTRDEPSEGHVNVSIVRPLEGSPFFYIFVGGLLIVGYDLLSKKRKDIAYFVKKEISGEKDRLVIYRIFRSKGGTRRIMIMEALDGPKKRSEVAKFTNIDWKEIDRNIKILESVGLVRASTNGKHTVFYELTEHGQNLLENIRARLEG
jgi:predicted transcriptional regulator